VPTTNTQKYEKFVIANVILAKSCCWRKTTDQISTAIVDVTGLPWDREAPVSWGILECGDLSQLSFAAEPL
jgi:hypothetical protein